MKKSYVIIINDIPQEGFTLNENTFDCALKVVRNWKQRGLLEGAKVVIRTIIENDEEISL